MTFLRTIEEVEAVIKQRKSDEYIRYAYAGAGYDVADRTQRMELVKHIADDYVKAHAEVNQIALDRWAERGYKCQRPSPIPLDSALIDRLTDVILDEELTDMHPDKMTRNEYPIMSERQEFTRREREYSIDLAESYDTDGINHAKPSRRRRTAKEERFIDKASRTKNRARNAQYKRDTSPGPVITYNLRDLDLSYPHKL
jgi:hypothetical protein